MKIHEKARLYDALLKDYEEAITELERHRSRGLEIVNEAESAEPRNYPMLCGSMQGHNICLDWPIKKMQGILKWYKNNN